MLREEGGGPSMDSDPPGTGFLSDGCPSLRGGEDGGLRLPSLWESIVSPPMPPASGGVTDSMGMGTPFQKLQEMG